MKKIKLTFSYQLPPGLRGRQLQPGEKTTKYPLIPIQLYKDNIKLPPIEALLDSGCDSIFIPKDTADSLNLILGEKINSQGVGGPAKSCLSKVGLIIGRGGREYDFGEVEVVVAEENQDVPVLIGRRPVFEEYQIVFEEYKDKFKLIPKEQEKKI
jgi:hypothetical protein